MDESDSNSKLDYHKMAEGYLAKKSYANSCFMFIRYIKIKMAHKTGVMSDLENIKQLVEASGFNISKEDVKSLEEIISRVLERKNITREDCMFAKKIAESIA